MQSFQNYNPSDQEFKSFVYDMLCRILDNQIDLEELRDLDPEEHPFNILCSELIKIQTLHLETQVALEEYQKAYVDAMTSFSEGNKLLEGILLKLMELVRMLFQELDQLKDHKEAGQ